MAKAIFIVNGLGLGNSTRCHAVIEALTLRGFEISVVTSGNGLWYFSGLAEVSNLYEIQPLSYGAKDGQISVWRTFRKLAQIFRTFRENARTIREILVTEEPDVVVIDSDYNFLPVKRLGIPIVSLNNADVVVETYRMFKDKPRSISAQFYGVEFLDYIFNRLVPTVTLSPCLPLNRSSSRGCVRRIGPIVRRRFRAEVLDRPPTHAVIMLSGSQFAMPVRLEDKRLNIHIDVIGRAKPDGVADRQNVKFHGKLHDTFDLIANADIAVVNGGYSAITEMFCMRKPMIVVPVPRHAEQWANARTIKELGVGEMATDQDFEDVLVGMLERIEEYRDPYRVMGMPASGAAQAAEIIEATIERRTS